MGQFPLSKNLTILALMVGLTLSHTFSIMSLIKNRTVKEDPYMPFFNMIASSLSDHESKEVFQNLQRNFFAKFSVYAKAVTAQVDSEERDDYIAASAFASLTNGIAKTTAVGNENSLESDEKKVVICGAKAKVKNTANEQEVRSVTVAEVIQANMGALTSSYATLKKDGTYNFDVKINDQYLTYTTTPSGEFVVSKIVSRKLLLNKTKTAIGTTNVYMLLIGFDRIQFNVYNMVVGTSIKAKQVLSKSMIDIQTYIVNKNGKLDINEGVFGSYNRCSFHSPCTSKHFGFLKINKKDLKSEQLTNSSASVDLNKKTQGSRAEYKSVTHPVASRGNPPAHANVASKARQN
jgi:hypothetical protein